MKKFILGLLLGVVKDVIPSSSDCPSKCSCTETSDSRGGVAVDCRRRGLKEIPHLFPMNTRTLDLSQNDIDFINELPDLAELITLNLTSNSIRGIHYDAFDGLDSLTNLLLSHNELSQIDDDIFEWNPLKLKRITLDHNRFEYIQHFLFYDLDELESIDLSNNILAFVHPHAFTELENLRELDLSHNNLRSFESKWVKPLLDQNLVEVRLDNNQWQCDCQLSDKIPFLTDQRTKSLLETAIVYRGKSDLKCTVSGKSKYLWDVTEAELTACSKPTITGISKSSSVESGKTLLLKCLAKGVPKPTIEWRAPNDDVYRLTSGDFEGITVHQDGSILIEDIRHNDAGPYVCVAKNAKGQIEATTDIKVTGEDKPEIDRNDDIDDIEDLNDDYWDPINGKIIGDGEDHEIIDELNDNPDPYNTHTVSEHDCPEDCDCNSDIVDCSDAGDMEHGKSKLSIPSKIPKTATHLDLNVNDIRSVGRDVCRYFDQLQELKLDENQITEIDDDAFKSCKKLRILTLRHNKLQKLPTKAFVDLKEVQILVLDNNYLEEIPDFAFEGMDELEYLYIRENRIKKIGEKAFHGLKSIRFIHLEMNRIDTLEFNWIKETSVNPNLKRIFLEENELMCDKRMKDFENDFTVQKDTSKIYKVIQPSGLECSFPVEQYGKRLDSLDFPALVVVEAVDIEQSGGSAGLLIGGIFLGIVLTALIFVVWRKWNRGQNIRHGLYSYQDISQDDTESRALTADQEAFI